jgi:hypothetical protein
MLAAHGLTLQFLGLDAQTGTSGHIYMLLRDEYI